MTILLAAGTGEAIVGLLFMAFMAFGAFSYMVPWRLWISAKSSGCRVGLMSLIAMRLRRTDPYAIVEPLIQAHKANLNVTLSELEAHHLSGGKVDAVITALISAHSAKLPLDFKKATAIDLAGRNVFQAVQMCVNPRVIESPMVTAMAKDGIQVKAKARITVQANIDKLIGGAGEDTIIARVGEGIVTTIGSSNSHKDILENPRRISEIINERGLDAETAFTIQSIDICDVDVGTNIGSKLSIDQSNADKIIAQAKAHEKRSNAIARESEMKALEQQMKAKLTAAEASIHLAIAESFKKFGGSRPTEEQLKLMAAADKRSLTTGK
jgi:uncharacterized protein YqfA (UPF0365 family)